MYRQEKDYFINSNERDIFALLSRISSNFGGLLSLECPVCPVILKNEWHSASPFFHRVNHEINLEKKILRIICRAAESSNCDSIATRPWKLLRFSGIAVLGRFINPRFCYSAKKRFCSPDYLYNLYRISAGLQSGLYGGWGQVINLTGYHCFYCLFIQTL